ncbi:MAG: right-handed parallel beta-helix repeat-containing protein [Thermoplasmata archaeon]|nr:MAG: right-handed parallel beta-helix repeat-containing protein [Thermoplasmata archaeon]
MYNKRIAVTWLSLAMLLSLIVIIVEIAPTVEAPTTWYVDDSNPGPGDGSLGNPFKMIQAGVDNATPGDTVYVFNGTYNEDVEINITINLTGESRDNVIINGSDSNAAIYVNNADYVNITGITAEDSGTGISLYCSNNSLIKNNKAIKNKYGIIINSCNNSIVKENIASNNSDYHGIHIHYTTNSTIDNNFCFNNDVGIWIQDDSYFNELINNNCSYNDIGINLGFLSHHNNITNNNIDFNTWYGIWDVSNGGNLYINNTIQNSWVGFYLVTFTKDVQIINSSINNSSNFDISLSGSDTYLTSINTTFNKNKVELDQITNKLEVRWYTHIMVIDFLGNPVQNANIKIEDNINGSYSESYITDMNGYVKWSLMTEYIEQKSGKTYITPHKIVAWNDTLVGYSQPIMNMSKTVTIVLGNGTLIDLEPGWNLVSLPRIHSDTYLPTILQSIEGRYDAVQWYNITDNNDPWKHNHISKPSNLNDLNEINHTMGLWVHITDPGGTTLVVFGDVLTSTQNISLYPGWNLAGYPSTTDKVRISALNNVLFDTEVDAIWTYNATTQKWKEITASDNFEVGRGYWIHSKVTKTWIVPL